MDLRDLRSFVTLARLNNITRAAEKLHLSPAAVHKHLKNLEDELGIRLYEKMGRRLRLTAVAHALLPHAEDLLVRHEATVSLVNQWKGLQAGLVRLGTGPGTSTCILPLVLGEFRKAYPDVEVQVDMGNTASLVQGLSDGSLDVAIMVDPDPPQRDVLDVRVAWEFDIALVTASPDVPRRCSIRDLAGEPFIMCKQSSQVGKRIDNYLAGLDIHPRVTMRVDNPEAIKAMLKLGSGISLLPVWVLEPDVSNGSLVRIEQTEAPLRARIIVAVRRGGCLPSGAEALIEIARTTRFPWLAQAPSEARVTSACAVRKP